MTWAPDGLTPPPAPQELQKCFDVKDVQMLQDAISKMDPTVSTPSPWRSLSGHDSPQWGGITEDGTQVLH